MVDKPQARRIPAPQSNPETRAFWEAAKAGTLMIGRCAACERTHYYPRSICPYCFAPGASLERASGKGTIYTLSVTYRGTPEPYAIGYVELEEGPRLLTNFIAEPLESLKIGDPVQVEFVIVEEGAYPVPMFKPATPG